MSDRRPSNDSFDAALRLMPKTMGPQAAVLYLKYTYSFANGETERCVPLPLENEIEQETKTDRGREEPASREGVSNGSGAQSSIALPPHTDFCPYKPATDVIVEGNAYAPHGAPRPLFKTALRIGNRLKEAQVFGPRYLRAENGRARIGPPVPIWKVSLGKEQAYGGADLETPVYAEPGSEAEAALMFDHPGIYPRNEAGKGYLATPHTRRTLAMPCLENPRDLLSEERIAVRKPYLWYMQPMPCFFGRTAMTDFPRLAFAGQDAWFLGPEDERMPEVAEGRLPARYRSTLKRTIDKGGFDPRFHQEAPLDMVFADIEPGTPFQFFNMHPEKPFLEFRFPLHSPAVEFFVGGERIPASPKLHNTVCFPDKEKFSLLYCAHIRLKRSFVPGIHRNIPLSARIDHETKIDYTPPEAAPRRALAKRKAMP